MAHNQKSRNALSQGGQTLMKEIKDRVETYLQFGNITHPDIEPFTKDEIMLLQVGAEVGLMAYAELVDEAKMTTIPTEHLQQLVRYIARLKKQIED